MKINHGPRSSGKPFRPLFVLNMIPCCWIYALVCCALLPGSSAAFPNVHNTLQLNNAATFRNYQPPKGSFSVNHLSETQLKEIDDLEYAVYTDFFSAIKLPPIEIPQFFKHAVEARKIFENTSVEKELKQDEVSYLHKSFGAIINQPFLDYKRKNSLEFLVKERIMVPGLTIFTKAQRDKLFSAGLSEVPSHVTGEYVSVSRVGFNEDKDTAFFKIIWNGSALTSYYVMMKKMENKWVIVNAIMDNMIIF